MQALKTVEAPTAMDTGMSANQSRVKNACTLFVALALVTAAGCGSEERVNTVSVLANTNCKGAPEGLTEVEFADIARFRGSKLVLSQAPKEQEQEEGSALGSAAGSSNLPLLVALSRGPQPSRGFELHLADQARVVSANALELEVFWTEPDTSRPQPLVTTSPCLVVSVPAGPWQHIQAIDQNGISLGALNRSP